MIFQITRLFLDEVTLVELYFMVDLILMLSTLGTFSKTNIEFIAFGTPVLTIKETKQMELQIY
jgi:hypothetical protein